MIIFSWNSLFFIFTLVFIFVSTLGITFFLKAFIKLFLQTITLIDNFFFFSFSMKSFSIMKEYFILDKNYLFYLVNGFNSDFEFNLNLKPIFIFFGLFFFLTTILVFFFSNYLGLYGVFLAIVPALLLFWLSSLPYLKIIFLDNIFFYVDFGKWINLSSNFFVRFDFYFDVISFSFLFLTLSIALSVIIFAFSYFRYEPLVERLIIFLSCFVCSMIFLVSTNNLINFFLGWELIGLTSFVLINFWHTKISTLKSSFKAYSFNKFSDASLLFCIVLIYNVTLELDITYFNSIVSNFNTIIFYFLFFKFSFTDILSFFFFFSASIKSAQIGFHIWLPDSMEAPVPASSLIHSATLVSAGIFIVLRFSNLFDNSYFFLIYIALIGSITAFYGGFTAMNQFDTKKILAYSTISHCGFLMVLCVSNIFEYVIIYLYIHGFFKAAIFMSIGNVNRLNKNNQDIRRMGGFFKFLPFESTLVSIGLFNLGGLPFSLGFYIKHILILSLKSHFFFFLIIVPNCIFASLTGLYYSFRLIFYIFFDFKKNKVNLFQNFNSHSLKSFFKSNSNFGSFISIFFLFILAYTIGVFSLNLYLSKNKIFSENFSMLEFSSIFFFFLNSNNIFIFFLFFNWLILINIFWLLNSDYRLTIKKINFNICLFFLLLFFNTVAILI